MAGYGAVISLKETIDRILESSRLRAAYSSRRILQLAYSKMERLQRIMNVLDSNRVSPSKSRKKVNALDGRIKDAVWRFEDLLESHLSHQILSQQFGKDDVYSFSVDLKCIQGDADSFIQMSEDWEDQYIYEITNIPEVEEDEYVSSRYDFGGTKAKTMFGSHDLFEFAKKYLTEEVGNNHTFTFVGMPGSGKTTLAEKLFRDPEVSRWFDLRVWITVGRKYELREIKRHILAQLDPNTCQMITESDEESKLEEGLKGKRCLIVLDDVWDTQLVYYFTGFLPEEENGAIRILLTTNLREIAHHMRDLRYYCNRTRSIFPLDEEESKDLLREKVFGEEGFPPQLDKAAEKIAKNCEGLPLMIVTVADLLSKANKNNDPEYWNEVAENRKSAVMMAARDQISKVLFPVYDCSPQYLKMLYLYIGAFPQDHDIPASKLRNIVAAEGILQRKVFSQILNEFSYGVIKSYVMSQDSSRYLQYRSFKTCRLSSLWCHLFNKEASKDKFLHILNSGVLDEPEENLKGQRRLSLHSNFVLNFKEVHDLVESNCASTVRSLLCFGPFHPYSIPLDGGFKLLRVLDALKVRFYSFPIEIFELVLMQYLALTYNGELPTSISKLVNLQFLIIHPYMSIKYSGAPSNNYVPIQIWDMQELKHIEILGRNLPNPNLDVSLKRLSTLLGVSAENCTRKVLTKLPNIRKLGIQIELMPESSISSPLSFFSPFAELENLDTLKCVVVNPEIKYGCDAPQTPISLMFPSRLRKLHLSGLGYPWKYTEVIGSMPHLQILKLRCYAFRGPKWEILGGLEKGSFLCLEYLVIEDTDLVQWEPGHGSFPKLFELSIKHCYKLRELHWPYAAASGRIELVDCNPLAFTCAKKLKPTNKNCSLQVMASFEDEELE